MPADLHKGSYRDFLCRHESESATAARSSKRQREQFARNLLQRVADPRSIRCAIDHVACEGGTAPGPNGLRLSELDQSERWELARALGRAIRSGTYRPGSHRKVEIPKGPGRGYRTLQIANVEDRVVQRALVQILQPFLDSRFSSYSFGYRPRFGREHALATADVLAERGARWSWVVDDIRDAFNHVPQARLLDVLRRAVNSAELLELIGVVIENQTGRGLAQGGSLSPLLLNMYLDHHLDRPWAKRQPNAPLIRVADDLLVLARDGNAAERCHEVLTALLRPAGFALKASAQDSVRNLHEGDAGEWLGLSLKRGTAGLEVRPSQRAWRKLDEHLALAHTKPHTPIRAYETIVGWVEQLGPCEPYLCQEELHEGIALLGGEHAIEEIPTRKDVATLLQKGRARYLAIRDQVLLHLQQVRDGGSARPRFLPARAGSTARES